MRVEARAKQVIYKVYIADDGQEFDNKKDCVFHDKLVHGEIKICEHCNGKGYFIEEYEDDNYHTGAPETYTRQVDCEHCKGKGYLEKKTVWE
jgi:DnaJ-class molecular chaperone